MKRHNGPRTEWVLRCPSNLQALIGLGTAAGDDQRRGGPTTGMAEVQNQNFQFNPFMSNSGMGLFDSVNNDQYSSDFPMEEGYFGGFGGSI